MKKLRMLILFHAIFIAFLYFWQFDYFAHYFNYKNKSLEIFVFLWGSCSLFCLLTKPNLVSYCLLLIANYFISPLREEFGSLSFSYVLTIGLFIESIHVDRKSDYDRIFVLLNYALISSLYLSLVKLRFFDEHWISGNGALIVVKTFHFKGLFTMEGLLFGSFLAKTLNYVSLVTEFLIGVLIWTRFRKVSMILGLIFHLALLFLTNITNWHLFMFIYFCILLFDEDFSPNNKAKGMIDIAKLNENSPEVTIVRK